MEVRDNSIYFDSIQSFYKATRKDRIQTLIDALKIKTDKKDDDKEVESWEHSLPDLAKLLYSPEDYYIETKKECDHYIKELPGVIDLIEEGNLAELEERMKDKEHNRNICKTFDRETMGWLKEMIENPEKRDDKKVISKCEDAINNQKKALEKQRKKNLTSKSPINAKVDIEYRLASKQRLDVLLSDPDQNKYVIIELKQWTEENIEVPDNKNGLKGEYVKIKTYLSRRNPALTVRDYREQLKKMVGEDAAILCLVYLHNQFYEKGTLSCDQDVAREIRYDKTQRDIPHWIFSTDESILYTRMRCDKFRKKIDAFFKCEIIEEDEE